MALGCFILLVTCGIEIPLRRTSSNYTLSDFYGTICRKNSSNISLPTEWFEEVHGELLGHNFRQLVQYCLVVFFYASQFATVEKIWLVKEREGASKLIPLATYIIPSTVNKEERKKAIVQLMMHKIKKNEQYFLYYMGVVSLYFILSICCVMTDPLNPFGYQRFAVSSNDSEWTVDCNRRPSSPDDYILTQCRNNSTDYNFESICIVPTGKATWYCITVVGIFAILAIFSVLILIWSAGEVCYSGLHSMNGRLC
ncbi:unnamed protein product [Larinioides sclopetarius]|uniref:Uncharacterized protein n=1 Tax=Larinioides sclopetarius TaxID=280406 RepID=A0AAV2BTG0_9ARAC